MMSSRPALALAALALAAATPDALTRNNCAKATTLATGTIATIMGKTPTLGDALTVSRAGAPLVEGATYTPGETLTVAVSGAGQYALYSTLGTFGTPSCGGKLVSNGPGTLTTPATGGPLTIAAARSGGGPGSNSPVTYERISLVPAPGGGVTPPIGGNPPGVIGASPPPPPPPPPPEGNRYISSDGSLKVEWEPAATSSFITVSGTGTGWVGFALSSDATMLDGGANIAIVGIPNSLGGGTMGAFVMSGKTAASMTPVAALPVSCGVDTSLSTLAQINGEVSFSFRLAVGSGADTCIAGGSTVKTMRLPSNTPATGIILARGSTPAFDGHLIRVGANALSADGSGVGGRAVAVNSQKYLHGLCMTVAWVILAPLAVYIAHFERDREPEGWWFKMHRSLLSACLLLTAIGFLLAINMVDGAHFHSLHSKLGLAFCLVLALQPLNAWYRPAKDDPGRERWQKLHKTFGSVLMAGSVIIALLGAQIIGAAVLVPLVLLIIGVAGAIFRKAKQTPEERATATRPKRQLSHQDMGLPKDWSKANDPATGQPYYINKKTGATQWEAPGGDRPAPPPPLADGAAKLPKPWQEMFDQGSGRVYYYNSETGDTSWTPPANVTVNRV